jgi:O-antigen/teichoic acid export membrane protein
MGHNRTILKTMTGAAAIQVLLLVLLVPRFAATGGAVAYAASMGGMQLVFAWIAHRELVQLKANRKTP